MSAIVEASDAGAEEHDRVDETWTKEETEEKREKEKRTSRACFVCRKRKSACHLYVRNLILTPCTVAALEDQCWSIPACYSSHRKPMADDFVD